MVTAPVSFGVLIIWPIPVSLRPLFPLRWACVHVRVHVSIVLKSPCACALCTLSNNSCIYRYPVQCTYMFVALERKKNVLINIIVVIDLILYELCVNTSHTDMF